MNILPQLTPLVSSSSRALETPQKLQRKFFSWLIFVANFVDVRGKHMAQLVITDGNVINASSLRTSHGGVAWPV
jgi:hypothetical protein